MAQIWKEQLDWSLHQNKMDTPVNYHLKINFVPKWIFFVRVCSFTFEFHTTNQIRECLAYYSQKIHFSSRIDIGSGDHWEFQRWFERLPMYLTEEPKRQKVVKALTKAIKQFEAEGFNNTDSINY